MSKIIKIYPYKKLVFKTCLKTLVYNYPAMIQKNYINSLIYKKACNNQATKR